MIFDMVIIHKEPWKKEFIATTYCGYFFAPKQVLKNEENFQKTC